MTSKRDYYDVFIAGAGPAACTFARCLLERDSTLSIGMADVGPKFSPVPGENLKNHAVFQRDEDRYAGMVRGLLNPISLPPRPGFTITLDPIAYQREAGQASTRNALNPRQNPYKNLPGAVSGHAIGGMAIHWTCVIPRHHPTLERIPFIPEPELNQLYDKAEHLLNRHNDVYAHSLRHQVIREELHARGIPAEHTPVASERRTDNPEFVRYSGADTILGDLAQPGNSKSLEIFPEHRVSHLIFESGKVKSALVRDVQTRQERLIHADTFIVAAGSVHSAQILWNSGIRPKALGRYLSDHTFTFCQVVLKEELVEKIGHLAGAAAPGSDPLPIPMTDPPPHLYVPVTKERPWHSQIHREAFQFNPVPPDVDPRLIVDLRWFGMIAPAEHNWVKFELDIRDRFGMPQPTFEFELGDDDRERAHRMLEDMVKTAGYLGGFMVGSDPTFVPLGASTHMMGATRMGEKDDGKSVVDPDSRVWGFENLYIGGNSVIPTANAVNPTLTTVALAVKSSARI